MTSTLLLLATAVAPLVMGDFAEVSTSLGMIRGLFVEEDPEASKEDPIPKLVTQRMRSFKGIPFAHPPVNDLRFSAPEPITDAYQSVLDATEGKSQCVQLNGGDEDCLYLNVYTPATPRADGKLRPVVVFIFGGAYVQGDAADYDGTNYASHSDVVFVTFNYRLGMLGFLANKKTLDQHGTTGNWGFLDQVAALKWVRDNISFFGGDPEQVTLTGESAGAFSVAAHLVSPLSQGLFHKAMLQSGTFEVDFFYQPMEDSLQFYEHMSKRVLLCQDVNDMECLRRIPASRFLVYDQMRKNFYAPPHGSRMFPFMPVGLTIDGTTMPMNPMEAAKQGLIPNIPLTFMTVKDEGTIFPLFLNKVLGSSWDGRISQSSVIDVAQYFADDASKGVVETTMKAQYPAYEKYVQSLAEKPLPSVDYTKKDGTVMLGTATDKAAFFQLSDAIGKFVFHCSTTQFVREVVLQRKLKADADPTYPIAPVYHISFAYDVWSGIGVSLIRDSMPDFMGGLISTSDLKVFHTADLGYVYRLFTRKRMSPNEARNPFNFYKIIVNIPLLSSKYEKAIEVSSKMSCLVANFVHCGTSKCDRGAEATTLCGEASGKWKPVNVDNYYSIYINPVGQFVTKNTKKDQKFEVENHLPGENECADWSVLKSPFTDLSRSEKPTGHSLWTPSYPANSFDDRDIDLEIA